MSFAYLLSYLVGVLIYPGGLALAVGLLPELRQGWGRWRAIFHHSVTPGTSAMILVAMLAASQLDIPFNPIPEGEHNFWLAGLVLMGGSWLFNFPPPCGEGKGRSPWGGGPNQWFFLLSLWNWLVSGAWLVALLALIIRLNTFHPPGNGLSGLVDNPVRLGTLLVYLLSLPTLLGLLGKSSEKKPFWLWWPYGGLFCSLLLPPSNTLLGLTVFLLCALGATAFALGEAWLWRRFPRLRWGAEVSVVILSLSTVVASALFSLE